jgi:hypothetical protein
VSVSVSVGVSDGVWVLQYDVEKRVDRVWYVCKG